MPATEPAAEAAPAGPPPAVHPMDPARGESLSPSLRGPALLGSSAGPP